MKATLVFLCCILFLRTSAQNNCPEGKLNPKFDAIFGTDSLLVYGAKNLYVHGSRPYRNKNGFKSFHIKKRLSYSCVQCSVTCYNDKGKKLWTHDLTDLNCSIIMFEHMDYRENSKYKGCDFMFQLKDKTLYGLKSRNGKIKRLKKHMPPF